MTSWFDVVRARISNNKEPPLACTALDLVLQYQTVVHQETGEKFRATAGAGVGLKFAGSLADIVSLLWSSSTYQRS